MILENLRPLVLECLKKDRPYNPSQSPLQLTHLCGEIAEIAKIRDLKYHSNINAWNMNGDRPELHANLMPSVADIVWDLIIEGILRPGAGNDQTFDLPRFHLTHYGKTALKDCLTPHDPEGYLKALHEKVQNPDPVIIRYVVESAETFRRNCLLSSTITLGCASEKAFLLVVDACEDALKPTDKPSFSANIVKEWSIKQKHIKFKAWYDNGLKAKLKASLKDNDWMTEFENALTFLFSYFRDIRNDAGHPTGVMLSREMVHSHLVVFPHYLRLFYDLIDWLGKNKPL